jgi:hypothetical protein
MDWDKRVIPARVIFLPTIPARGALDEDTRGDGAFNQRSRPTRDHFNLLSDRHVFFFFALLYVRLKVSDWSAEI